MKTLRDFQFEEKRTLVRCDLNVPLDEEGSVRDDFRIRKLVPTVEELMKKNARIILLTHLGRKKNGEAASVAPLVPALEKAFGRKVTFVKECVGGRARSVTSRMKPGEIVLLENVRTQKGETENDEKFAKQLADLADVYVNEAFSVCHRAHASVASVPRFVPSGAGLQLEQEVRVLSKTLEDPWRPFVVVIGGAKVKSKARLINAFLRKADHVIVGGEIANAVLAGKGMSLGRFIEEDELREEIEQIDITDQKLHLPVDGTIVLKDYPEDEYVRTGGIGSVRGEEKILDVGPETRDIFSRILGEAKLILWSGPLGLFEHPRFEEGTGQLVRDITRNHSAFKIAGGGDTIAALHNFGAEEKFDHVSVGGGAVLSYLAGEDMPGLSALHEHE